MNGGDECGNGLSDDNEHAFDRVGVLGGERGSDAGVSELYLVIAHHHSHSHSAEAVPHAFLIEVLHHLELLLKGNAGIIPYIKQSLLILLALLLLLVFLLDHLANVRSSNHSHTNVSSSQSSHIVGSVSCVENASVWQFLEELDNDLFVMRTCSCEDVDVLVIIVRKVLGC